MDTRNGNGKKRDAHAEKWQEKFAEYLAIEGDAAYDDDKLRPPPNITEFLLPRVKKVTLQLRQFIVKQ